MTSGYTATIKHGTVSVREGKWTAETPGGPIRGPQHGELGEVAE